MFVPIYMVEAAFRTVAKLRKYADSLFDTGRDDLVEKFTGASPSLRSNLVRDIICHWSFSLPANGASVQ